MHGQKMFLFQKLQIFTSIFLGIKFEILLSLQSGQHSLNWTN